MKYALFVLVALATPTLADQTCTVQTFRADGTYVATVLTGDGKPLSKAAAEETAAALNANHNNGKNPIVARPLFCN